MAVRLFLAIMVCGAGVAAAVAASNITVSHSNRVCSSPLLPDGSCPGPGSGQNLPGPRYTRVTSIYRPEWVVPLSILIGFAGVAGGAVALTMHRAKS
jgi:hypothetical protein